ncbi:MAG: hypothetical protein ACOYOB_04450 [Myxococcota bacterium]
MADLIQPTGNPIDPNATSLPDDDEDGGGLRLNVTIEEKLDVAQQVSTRLFELLGAGVPGIDCRSEEDQVVVRLADLDPALFPAGDTRVLESLQFILNKAINRYALKRTRLSLDTEGFRRRRPEGLDKVAAALAQKVTRLNKSIAIGPIGQGDLRFLTAQLTRSPGVQVHSFGAPDKRRLVILPVGAPGAEPAASGEPIESSGERKGRRRRRR